MSYQYDQMSVDRIFWGIVDKQALGNPIKLNFPKDSQDIGLPRELGGKLIEEAKRAKSKKLVHYGFRLLRHLIRLTKANALAEGRQVVTEVDVNKTLELAAYCNLDYKHV